MLSGSYTSPSGDLRQVTYTQDSIQKRVKGAWNHDQWSFLIFAKFIHVFFLCEQITQLQLARF